MQIKELADLTGTTVRTIRYYHQIGLLPVPEVRYGHRDYALPQVARLTRIRWLAQAGIPLSRIATLVEVRAGPPAPGLDPEAAQRETVLIDLRATVVAVDEQLDRLQARREQLVRLLAAVDRGDPLSLLPAPVSEFYDRLEQRASTDAVRRAVRQERDYLELAFFRGDMPPEAVLLYQGLDEAQLAASLEDFGLWTAHRRNGRPPGEAAVTELVQATVSRMHRLLGPDLPRVARSVDPDVARRAADLYVRVCTPDERPAARAVADALLTLIEEARR